MDYVIGIMVALTLTWALDKGFSLVRENRGIALSPFMAMALGLVAGIGVWYLLRTVTPLSRPIIDGFGLGVVLGISGGLRRPDAAKK